MTEAESKLWERYGRRDETARKELVLFYFPLVEVLAKRIAHTTGANWEDLRQEGVLGLIKAVARFDPGRGVPFRAFAKQYICGAIFDSSELTRDMTRRQGEIYRKVRQTQDALMQMSRRYPTIEEVAEKAELTIEQIRNAIDARSVAFARALPDSEDMSMPSPVDVSRTERTIFLLEALAHLNKREREITRFYYWEDESHEEIASKLGLTVGSTIKIRQRAIGKLRKRLGVKPKGEQDEHRRSGK